jgi:hypothetical protein
MPRRKRKTSAATPVRSVNNTYKELGYVLYMTRRFTIEIEYNGHW